jgi:hypothetical protein
MDRRKNMHEDFERDEEVKSGSERTFGIVFSVFLFLMGIAPLWHGLRHVRVWALLAAVVFLGLALFWTPALKPFNRAWTKLGLLLHAVMNPLILILLFFGAVTPFGIVRRLCNRDPLHLKFDRDTPSYWIVRNPADPHVESMKNQF